MAEKNKKPMDIVSKMTLIGIGAVVVLLIGITLAVIAADGKKVKVEAPADVTEEVMDEVVDESSKELIRAIAVVKYLDVATGQLMVHDIEKEVTVTLKMDSSIVIKDEYGTDIALSQIEVGDMIETKYDGKTLKPITVKITAITWQRKDVSNMVVDIENKTIRLSNETYTYTNELVTSNNGVPFDLSEITPADEAVVKGYKDKVWSIVLVNGHGTINLVNHESFVGGHIQIGNRINLLIETVMSIPISAGVHDIVIEKDGMATFTTQVMVNVDEEVTIDLSTAQPKVGTIDFIVLQEGVSVFLDNEQIDTNATTTLDFGTYTIRAEKENYATWESELVLAQAYMQFKIDLEKSPTFLNIQEPAGAEAYIDGVFIGLIPTQTPFNAGSHAITLRQDGYKTETYNFIWDEDGLDKNLVLPAMTAMPVVEVPTETPVEAPTEPVVE